MYNLWWLDCVKDDMTIKGVSMEMTSDRREWKKKTCCADPHLVGVSVDDMYDLGMFIRYPYHKSLKILNLG
jgi:hypothetical protein